MSNLDIVLVIIFWFICYIAVLCVVNVQNSAVSTGLIIFWPLFVLKAIIIVLLAVLEVLIKLIIYIITNFHKIIIETIKALFSWKV